MKSERGRGTRTRECQAQVNVHRTLRAGLRFRFQHSKCVCGESAGRVYKLFEISKRGVSVLRECHSPSNVFTCVHGRARTRNRSL